MHLDDAHSVSGAVLCYIFKYTMMVQYIGFSFKYGASHSTMICPTPEDAVGYQSGRMGLAFG